MPSTVAFEVGRDQYVVDALAFRGVLDGTVFRVQCAAVGSQDWRDAWTLDTSALFTLPSYLVAALPAAAPAGALALATDLSSGTHLTPAAGGGAITAVVVQTAAGWVVA